ncbi:T9SS type A sorting domain-containing protein [Lishizhenia tianjinensis]|nr:T9SS type A sorting domain-containing protein [Lishizhenia tianjinensis]
MLFMIVGFMQSKVNAQEIETRTLFNWNGSSWTGALKMSYTYSSTNELSEILHQSFQNSQWINSSKNTYINNLNGSPDTIQITSWNAVNSTWDYTSRYTFTYNTNNQTIAKVLENYQNNAWVNMKKFEYQYDLNGNLIEEKQLNWDSSNAQWTNKLLIQQTFLGNGKLLQRQEQTWDTTAVNWVNSTKVEHSYTASLQYDTLFSYAWNTNSNDWTNFMRTSFHYDANDHISYKNQMQWNQSLNSWNNYVRVDYATDTLGKVTESITKAWISSPGIWFNLEKDVRTYTSPTAITENETIFSLDIFPNPVQSKVHIRLHETGNSTIQVVDNLGRTLCTELTDQQEIELDLSTFPSGTYYLHIFTDHKQVTRKIIKK